MHHFVHRYHKRILLFAVLLSAVSIFFALRLKLDLSLIALLPSDNSDVQNFFEITDQIGTQSLLITVVEADAGLESESVADFVDLLAQAYKNNKYITQVDYKRSPENLERLFQTLLAYIPALLAPKDMQIFADMLSDKHIDQKIAENKMLLMTPFSIAAKERVSRDPLGIGDFLYSSLYFPGDDRGEHLSPGHYRTKDHSAYFLFLSPTEPPQNLVFSKKLMLALQHIEERLLTEFAPRSGSGRQIIRIRHTGGYPIAVQDEATTKLDIKITLVTSFIGVMLLFYLSFRTPGILLYVAVPLSMSLLWTIGFAGLVFQRLNILAGIFACVLIGLGIDFAIHIVNRFFDPGQTSSEPEARLGTAYRETGTGILVGGLTTSAAFYSLVTSDFDGFRELGLLAGTGILFCVGAMMLVLPSLLMLSSPYRKSEKPIAVSGFGLQPICSILFKHPAKVVLVSICLITLLAIVGLKSRFDDNLKNFRSADNTVLMLQEKVTRWLGGSTGVVLLSVSGAVEENVISQNAEIFNALQELRDTDRISVVNSIGRLLGSPANQRRNIDFLQSHPSQFDVERIRSTFDKALERHGFRADDVYDVYFKQLGRAFAQDEPMLPSHLDATDLGNYLKRFFFQKDGKFTAVTSIHPPADLWSYDETRQFKRMIVQKLTGQGMNPSTYRLTGANLLTGELKRLILQNLKTSFKWASLSILLVLLIYYRNLKNVFLAVLPLLTGMGILSGLMVLLRVDFNFLNVMVLPMIVGIGIDDGIHFTNTYRQSDPATLHLRILQTGRAVVLTSLTTLVGFGSIILSHYPGLRSMGYVAVIGITACLLAAIVLLPSVFLLIRAKNPKY